MVLRQGVLDPEAASSAAGLRWWWKRSVEMLKLVVEARERWKLRQG